MVRDFTSRQALLGPFDSRACIEFNLPDDALVAIKVYDITGEEVDTLVNNKHFEAGIHRVTFNTEGYDHSVHLYRISMQSGGRTIVEVKRVLSTTVN